MIDPLAKNALYTEFSYMYPLTGDQVSNKFVLRYLEKLSLEVNMITFSSFSSVKNVAIFDHIFRPFPEQSGRFNHQNWIPHIKKWSGSDILRIIYIFFLLLLKYFESMSKKQKIKLRIFAVCFLKFGQFSHRKIPTDC